jgi:hypothetical protein
MNEPTKYQDTIKWDTKDWAYGRREGGELIIVRASELTGKSMIGVDGKIIEGEENGN